MEAISRKRGPTIRVPCDCGSSGEVLPRADKDSRCLRGSDDLARRERNSALSADRLQCRRGLAPHLPALDVRATTSSNCSPSVPSRLRRILSTVSSRGEQVDAPGVSWLIRGGLALGWDARHVTGSFPLVRALSARRLHARDLDPTAPVDGDLDGRFAARRAALALERLLGQGHPDGLLLPWRADAGASGLQDLLAQGHLSRPVPLRRARLVGQRWHLEHSRLLGPLRLEHHSHGEPPRSHQPQQA